ncbi:acyloxyacyl hydrolase [Pseudoalteromonas sp. SR45-5]|uniref:acyloxyacyl hydrolase n=1 Tax=Pseudoalteromonas sp. SR45-5 TaxID=2760928 RepID=UPI0015F91E40|nr:acyloxyacyl hydrolase [Pseudoalteromonas sp. SR45-5]MBB1355117.1 acyloxyacyl hydrolase [Pseudoalteromonas sp. SR45-5]
MKTSLKTLIISSVLVVSLFGKLAFAQSDHGYAVDFLKGEGNVNGVKLAYQYHAPGMQNIIGDARFYFETSVNMWEYRHGDETQSNLVLAMSPVLQFPAFSFNNTPFYVEAGIGVSLIDETQFAGKNISTHYQFEDRIGLVADFGHTNVALRVIHYSNAGFKEPNPGLNFLTLSVARRF